MPVDLSASAASMEGYLGLRRHMLQARARAASAAPAAPDPPSPSAACGHAPVRGRHTALPPDIGAEYRAFVEVCLSVLTLHSPRDGGGLSSDPHDRPQRCAGCMRQWPCPTVRLMRHALKDHAACSAPVTDP